MKKNILLTIIVSATVLYCQAQNPILWGLTSVGGKTGVGTVFQTDVTGDAFQSDYSFFQQSSLPVGNVIQATNNLLYGMTSSGGLYGKGDIFSVNISTNIETDLYDFGNGKDGKYPQGSLFQASDTLLYGMTQQGGTNDTTTDGDGIIFSYNIKTGKETVLHDFGKGTDGKGPDGAFIQVNDSLLYGMTAGGGREGLGTIFTYNISSVTETDLHDFNGSSIDGASPVGSLLLAKDSLLYGMTSSGGFDDAGIIFRFNIVKDSDFDVHDFNVSSGEIPLGALIQATDSLLYGITELDGVKTSGVIFSFNTTKDTFIALHTFGNGLDGEKPNGSLIQANDSLLYGVTTSGGTNGINGYGTIFSYNIRKGIETVVHDFAVIDGKQPYGSLIQAANGLLYGSTFAGGAGGDGVLFSFNDTTNTETVVANSAICNDDNQPNGSLIKASNGLFYGLTQYGGSNNEGSIFSYNSATGQQIPLHDFGNGTDGQSPYSSLLEVTDSLLFGVTPNGGANGDGIIFKYNISTGKETDVHDFSANNGGVYPYGSLIMANNGLLYGTTASTLFSYNVVGGAVTDLHDFGNGTDGEYSYGPLMQASDSVLYGMTVLGGTDGAGTLFSYNISEGKETVVHNFTGVPDGSGPNGSLFQAYNGLLYGMTYAGGSHDEGTIFSYNITTGVKSNLVSFDGTNGQNPAGEFIQAKNNLLYATTTHGGTDNDGTVISFNTTGNIVTVIHSFTGNDGDNPYGDLLDIDTTTTGIPFVVTNNNSLTIYPNPTSGQFTIKTSDNQTGYTTEVFNAMGEKIYQSVNKPSLGDLGVNLSSQPAGLYFIYLSSNEGVEVGKIMVTK